MKFSCLRRGPSDDHCDICTVWPCGIHLSPGHLQDVCSEILVMIALFHRSWLCSSAVVRLVFALCGLWRTSHHHDIVARSKKLGITWRWFYSFLLCEKSASVHQCFLCVVWSRDEHFAAFIVESSLLRVVVKVFLVATGSQTQSCFLSRVWLNCTNLLPSFEGRFEANSFAMHLHCVVSWCSAYHLFVPPWSMSCSHERMVSEILAARQMLFHAMAPAIALLLQLVRDVVGRSERWTWQGWFTMLLWWTPYHHDFGGTHSKRSPGLHSGCLHAVFIERRLSDYLYNCCTVWSRDTHTSHCHIWRYFVQKCWCAYGTCSVLLYVIRSHGWSLLHSYCMFLWWTPYHQDLRGFLWQVMVGMVDAIHVCFCDGASIVFVLKTATFWRTVPWWKQTTLLGFLEDICKRVWLTWCFLDCEEVPARIIAIFAQFGLVIHTIGLHTCKTFPPNTWWHFVQLSCVCSWAVVRLVVALCGLVENIMPPWCVRGALSEAWKHMMVVLPFRCLRRGPSHDQCYICIEWLCGTHESYWLLQEVCT